VLSWVSELSEKIELNRTKIDGILNKFLNSVLFNKALRRILLFKADKVLIVQKIYNYK